jgi:hypothetical protein
MLLLITRNTNRSCNGRWKVTQRVLVSRSQAVFTTAYGGNQRYPAFTMSLNSPLYSYQPLVGQSVHNNCDKVDGKYLWMYKRVIWYLSSDQIRISPAVPSLFISSAPSSEPQECSPLQHWKESSYLQYHWAKPCTSPYNRHHLLRLSVPSQW